MNTQLTAACPRVYTYPLQNSILSSLPCRFCTFETFFIFWFIIQNTVFLFYVVLKCFCHPLNLNPSFFFFVSKGCDYRKPKVLFTFYHKCVCHSWRCFYGQYYTYTYSFRSSTVVDEQHGLIGGPFLLQVAGILDALLHNTIRLVKKVELGKNFW